MSLLHRKPLPGTKALPLGLVGTRRSACIDRDATVSDACKLMRAEGVSELVVTENTGRVQAPAGIVSARDIVTRICAAELDAGVMTVGDILWSRTSPLRTSDSIHSTLQRLCATGGEAVPILDGEGNLAGVVSLDDLLPMLAAK
jgi:CBS domain-containing protein